MISRLIMQYRFLLLAIMVFFLSTSVFADSDLSATISLSTLIINAGFGILVLLSLYVLVLTVVFIFHAFQDAAEAKKEAKAHAAEESEHAPGVALNPEISRRSFLSLLGW